MATNRRFGLALLVILSILACNLPRLVATPSPTLPPPTAPALPTQPPTVEASPSSAAPEAPPTSEPSRAPEHPDWPAYRNETCGFGLRYPPDSLEAAPIQGDFHFDLPITLGTNLSEKYLEVSCRTRVSPCASPFAEGFAPGSLSTEIRELHGIEFAIQSAAEGAAGSIYEWVSYSTTRGDSCASLTFILHSTNPLNYTPPLPEFDREAESAIFEEIVSTFAWLIP
ncbi:MAG TPA: hypothetical protein VJ123_03095 [Anaerolineales bacterium]|nr:hypothetical protein [Anaerolineales bacterium]